MRAVAFVPVRLSSSRLPRKHFKLIGNRTLFSWVSLRLKKCRELDEVVICAPDEVESRELYEACEKERVFLYIYKGDVNDVVGRLVSAAREYEAEICVLASGDCPLLSSSTIDRMVRFLKDNPEYDMVVFDEVDGRLPVHEGIMVARRHVWELADIISDTPELREHQFPVINLHREYFSHLKAARFKDDDIFYKILHRISVDTPSDLEFMNRVYRELKEQGKDFELENVIGLLMKRPDLMDINKNVYRKKVGDKNRSVLFVIGSKLSKCKITEHILRLAKRLVELGVGVKFALIDEHSKEICEKNHFGAFLVRNFANVDSYVRIFDMFIFFNEDSFALKYVVDVMKVAEENGKKIVLITGGFGKEDWVENNAIRIKEILAD